MHGETHNGWEMKKENHEKEMGGEKTHRKVVFVTPNGLLGDKNCK
jgi:hypothetical protein